MKVTFLLVKLLLSVACSSAELTSSRVLKQSEIADPSLKTGSTLEKWQNDAAGKQGPAKQLADGTVGSFNYRFLILHSCKCNLVHLCSFLCIAAARTYSQPKLRTDDVLANPNSARSEHECTFNCELQDLLFLLYLLFVANMLFIF
jgi:hypothetical protein